MYLNKQIFHDFYYGGDGGRSNSNTHFVRNHFFSYDTEIGCIVNIAKPAALISDGYFSITTAAHRSALEAASPYEVVCVDFDWNDDFTQKSDKQVVQEMRKRQVHRLRNRVKALHRQEKERLETLQLLDNFERLMVAGNLQLNQTEQRLVDKLKAAVADTEENQLKWREERRKVAQATRKKAAREKKAEERKERKVNQTRELVKQWLKERLPNFGELLEARFQNQYAADSSNFSLIVKLSQGDSSARNDVLNKELRHRVELPDWKSPSYVWQDPRQPDQVSTSQGIQMDVSVVRTAYKVWKRGKLEVGMHVGPYTVRELTDDYIQIGCHCIPMLNIAYLAEKLQLEA